MKRSIAIGALAAGSLLLLAAQAQADGKGKAGETSAHTHSHEKEHAHADASEKSIYKGYFEDSQIEDRPLSDWEGNWQSVYPYLSDGTLDPVMARKAENGSRTAEEYRAYYDTGYRTDVDRILIEGDSVTFFRDGSGIAGQYAAAGYEILTYAAGNRGVRYIFEKSEGDSEAPGVIQFSDHKIAPAKAGHYHLYWGDDRKAILEELTNWPTYYPAALSGEEIVHEMLAH